MELWALAVFWAVHLAAVASPGPSFVVVSRAAASGSVSKGVRVAAGLSAGTFAWAAAAWFGLSTLFAVLPALYAAVRFAGALFLIYIAVQLWRHAAEPLPASNGEPSGSDGAFRLGVLTQLSNPKVAVFFGSVFATVLPPDPDAWTVTAAFAIVCFNEFAWYALVALAFSRPAMRRGYARAKAAIDRITGGLLAALAGRLLVSD